MTTAERLKRRQRRTGWAVIMLAFGSILYGIYDNGEAHRRDDCMAQSFSESSRALNARARLSVQSTAIQTQMDSLQNQVILDVAAAGETSEVVAAFNRFHKDLDRVHREQRKLLEVRQHTKLPGFPEGKCD